MKKGRPFKFVDEKRLIEVAAYLKEGHTVNETAEKFGLTYNQVMYMRDKAQGKYKTKMSKKPRVMRRAKMQVIPEAPQLPDRVLVIVTTPSDLSAVLRGIQ